MPPPSFKRTTGSSPPARIFRPRLLQLAPLYQCNLACPHCCVPIEWTDRLPVAPAVRFLEEAHASGIGTLGFTGGEPFLYPEFLTALTGRAAELGFKFDKLMTNGVWHTSAAHAEGVLSALRGAGFGGKIGLSVDKFHGMDIAKLAEFCRITRAVFARDTVLSLSYASRDPHKGLEPIRRLAEALGGVVEWSKVLGRYLLVSDDFTMTACWNHLATVERAEALPGTSWDGTWFEEDYCEGPGQALIVNPKGEVKPCCGFASDLDQLTIGNIHTDSVEEIITFARNHPVVGTIFRDGLSAIRDEILAHAPDALPGATSNHCYFCWYVLSKGIYAQATGKLDVLPQHGGSQWAKIVAGKTALPVIGEGTEAKGCGGGCGSRG
ncbi:MAG TPA: radical SAM/SPASM domain-containing protein [Gemmata sp.]